MILPKSMGKWIEGHPWTLWYIAVISTINMILNVIGVH